MRRSSESVKTKPNLKSRQAHQRYYEVTFAPGLEPIVVGELQQRLTGSVKLPPAVGPLSSPGALVVDWRGAPGELLALRTVSALYLITSYDVPRPSALLGDQHFRRLVQGVEGVLRLYPSGAFPTVGLNATGASSPVLQRLLHQLADRLELQPMAVEQAALELRLRPARLAPTGWEVLIRLSPRPLSVRSWRVRDVKGALNAAVAAAMILWTRPQPGETFFNPCCGSGTLLAERLLYGPLHDAIGCDTNPAMLAYAGENVAATGRGQAAQLHGWDACTTPLATASVDTLCVDLPFGLAIGAHHENRTLYPALLAEAGRVARRGARFALLTQEVHLIDQALRDSPLWRRMDELSLTLRGLHPRLYLLRRE